MENKQLTFFDVFSGIGGFKIAFERAGFKCMGYCDNDKYAVKLYQSYFATQKELYFNDINKINTKELPDFDILCAGFPCQPFSAAGKRQGFKDQRGTAIFKVIQILKTKKTKFFVLENVKGLLVHEKGRTFEAIIEMLTDIGYCIQWQVLNSKFFGLPQSRERVFIVGCLATESQPKIFPIRGIKEEKVKDIKHYKFIKRYSQANATFAPDGIMGCLTKGCDGFIGNLNSNLAKSPENMTFRRLTPLECFRLQGFPDDLVEKAKEINISNTQLYNMAGNAVSVNVVEVIARKLAKSLIE